MRFKLCIGIFTLFFFLVQCYVPAPKTIKVEEEGKPRIKPLEVNSYYGSIIQVDEHQYYRSYSGGVVHLESCPANHK